MPFPSPPWRMRGQLWASLFRAAAPGGTRATWGVAFVSYEPGSTLTYSELMVARRATGQRGAVTVRDIWVDSEESRDGGRSLWAVPKELAVFEHSRGGLGPVRRASWAAATGNGPVAEAQFADTSRLQPLVTPFRGTTLQHRPDGSVARAALRGRSRPSPCLASWEFAADGPLGWLHGRHPFASFRLRDVEMEFG